MLKRIVPLFAVSSFALLAVLPATAQETLESPSDRMLRQNEQTTGPGNSTPTGPAAIDDPAQVVPTDPQEGSPYQDDSAGIPPVVEPDGAGAGSSATGAASGEAGTNSVDGPEDQAP